MPRCIMSLDSDVCNVGRGVRLGMRVLLGLEIQYFYDVSFRVADFDRARVYCEIALTSVSFVGRDLCDLMLSYV